MARSPHSPRCRTKAPEIKPEQLKKPTDFRLIGKDVMRVELPSKVNGSAQYGIDVQVPGMLYGAVLRAPVEGVGAGQDRRCQGAGDPRRRRGRPAALRRRRRRRDAVGGVRGAAGAGRLRDLDPNRQRPGASTATRGSTPLPPTARDLSQTGARLDQAGDCSRRVAARPPSTMEANICCDYAYHAQMEPLNAVASVSPAGDAVEIWAGTQSQTTATGSDRQGARHSARQGQAARHADGRRLRPPRQARCRFHRRRGDAVEGGGQAGEGDVDARGRRPQRPLPAAVGALPARRRSMPRASSSHGIIAMSATG